MSRKIFLEIDEETAGLVQGLCLATAEKAARKLDEDPSCATYPDMTKVHIERLRKFSDLILENWRKEHGKEQA